jgi:hypothetical protein
MAESLFERMKAEAKRHAKEIEDRPSFDKIPWFVPKPGDNTVRILPHWKNPNDEFPHVKKMIHYLPKKLESGRTVEIPMACLEMFDKECPACKTFQMLKAKGSDKADSFRQTKRYLYNVLDYGVVSGKKEAEPSVKVYAAPASVYDQIMVFVDEMEDPFWSFEKGRDWRIKKKMDASKGAKFGTSYKVIPSMKTSAIQEKLKSLISNTFNLDKIWNETSEEVMIAEAGKLGLKFDGAEETETEVDVEADEFEEAPKTTAKVAGKRLDDRKTKPVAKAAEKQKAKPSAKKTPEPEPEDDQFADDDDDEEDIGVDTGGDVDLENELRNLGI